MYHISRPPIYVSGVLCRASYSSRIYQWYAVVGSMAVARFWLPRTGGGRGLDRLGCTLLSLRIAQLSHVVLVQHFLVMSM